MYIFIFTLCSTISHGEIVCPKMDINFIPKRDIKRNKLLKDCTKYMDSSTELVRYIWMANRLHISLNSRHLSDNNCVHLIGPYNTIDIKCLFYITKYQITWGKYRNYSIYSQVSHKEFSNVYAFCMLCWNRLFISWQDLIYSCRYY